MNFSLDYTKEQEAFAQEVREFLDGNVPADLGNQRDPLKLSEHQFRERRELGRKLGQKGWLYPAYPKEYASGGLADLNYTMEELLRESRTIWPPLAFRPICPRPWRLR